MKKSTQQTIKKRVIIIAIMLMMSVSMVGYGQAATSLTVAEKYWLTYMREEEKLARDVYIAMYNLWGASIFNTIQVSEQKHMDAIKNLLVKYGIPDPAADDTVGKFTNQDIQDLYNRLIEQGNISLVEALKVGVEIEETDIDDLNSGIASTTRKDIKNVYTNLLQGSLNHLKAFVSNLAAQGVTYEP